MTSGISGKRDTASLRLISEDALLIEYGDTLDDALHSQVRAVDAALQGSEIAAEIETLPTFRSLLVKFDPFVTPPEVLIEFIEKLDVSKVQFATQCWRVPVCLRDEYAEDLPEVAQLLGASEAQIRMWILGSRLKLFMYGFAPGFAYLGGLDEQLAIPRRKTPRAPMPGGSLMIAGGLASLASVSMPTGWYVIGRTPVQMFSADRPDLVPFAVGDTLAFYEVNEHEYVDLDARGDRAGLELI